jgi:predicted anti-sigma-YlaC factor YlaD
VSSIGQTAMNIVVGSCEQTGQRLSMLLEGELRGPRKWRVRMHLWRCERCRAVLSSLAQALEQIQQLAREQFAPPQAPSVADAVVERIRSDPPAT